MSGFASLAAQGATFTSENLFAKKPAASNDAAGGADKDEDGDEEGGDDPQAHESTAQFKAVVQLKEVETKTGEEDEDVQLKERAKLYVFGERMLDKGKGNKEWIERGKGEVKILKHKENMKSRLLMREDGTKKIKANHYIEPRIEMKPYPGSDKSVTWQAHDFSDSIEIKLETFCLKFSTAEICNAFTAAFEKAKEDNKRIIEGGDSSEGSKEANEAAALVAQLSTSEKAESPKKTESPKKQEQAVEEDDDI